MNRTPTKKKWLNDNTSRWSGNHLMDPEVVPKLMASGTIEVAPLAYMRGRTLNDSFVVLDEAQNTTPEQM